MELFLALHVSLELSEIAIIADVEREGHCWINFGVVNLLCLLLVVLDVILFDQI